MIDNYTKNKQTKHLLFVKIYLLTNHKLTHFEYGNALSKSIEIGFNRTNFDSITSYFKSIFSLNLKTPASLFAIDCRKQYPCSDREIISFTMVKINLTSFCHYLRSLA